MIPGEPAEATNGRAPVGGGTCRGVREGRPSPAWRGSRTVQTFVFPRPRVPLTSSSRPDASSAVRAPVSPVCDARRGAQLLGRQVAYIAALVCQRSHRRKEQPLGSSRRAVRQNRLAQLDDDVVAPPRTSISEHESDGARSAAGSGALVDRQQPACDQVLPRLLRWNGYEHLAPHQRQVCWSHIQRDFRRHSEGLAEQKTFGQHGLELTARVFRAWRSYQQEHHNRDQLKAEIAPIQAALRRLLEQASPKSRRTRWHRRFANNLLKIWPALWTFVTIEGVEPTNNPSRTPAPRPGHPSKTLPRHQQQPRRTLHRTRPVGRRDMPPAKPLTVRLPPRTHHRTQPRRPLSRSHLSQGPRTEGLPTSPARTGFFASRRSRFESPWLH